MGGDEKFIPTIILHFVIPSSDNTEQTMRNVIQSIDDVSSVEFHRSSEATHLDNYIAFPAKVHLDGGAFSLGSTLHNFAKMTAAEICEALACEFPSEEYSVSWSMEFRSANVSSVYKMAPA